MKYQWALCSALVAAVGCGHVPVRNNLPPAVQIMQPGPGVGGPGPGVMLWGGEAGAGYTGAPAATSQVAFVGPEGMMVGWSVSAPNAFDSEPLVVPGRFNFGQGAIYQLKLTNIPGRPGVELYPSLEVGPATPRTDAYLAHNSIPFQLTEEDFDQVLSGNFVTKVIYLPDAEFQELALAGVETLVSTRLDPGLDPIVEADKRGAILAIIRIGNKDLELAGGDQVMGGGGMMAGAYGPGCGMPGGGLPPQFVAGMTGPQYGMPITGTPIGLPGPPHIPLGIPAGLQSHTMVNHTHTHIPGPVDNVRIDVKQTPGLSYPAPASHVFIHERAAEAPVHFHQPYDEKYPSMGGGGMGYDAGAVDSGAGEYCPPGQQQ